MLNLEPMGIECYKFLELGEFEQERAIESCKEIIYDGVNDKIIPENYQYEIEQELRRGFGDYFTKEGIYLPIEFKENENKEVVEILYNNLHVRLLNAQKKDRNGNYLSIGDKIQVINNKKTFIIKDFGKYDSIKIGKNGLRNYEFKTCKIIDVVKVN